MGTLIETVDVAPVLRTDQRTQSPFEFRTSTATRFVPSGIDTEIELLGGATVSVASRQVGPGEAIAGHATIKINKNAEKNRGGDFKRGVSNDMLFNFISKYRRWQRIFAEKSAPDAALCLKSFDTLGGWQAEAGDGR